MVGANCWVSNLALLGGRYNQLVDQPGNKALNLANFLALFRRYLAHASNLAPTRIYIPVLGGGWGVPPVIARFFCQAKNQLNCVFLG